MSCGEGFSHNSHSCFLFLFFQDYMKSFGHYCLINDQRIVPTIEEANANQNNYIHNYKNSQDSQTSQDSQDSQASQAYMASQACQACQTHQACQVCQSCQDYITFTNDICCLLSI